MPAVELRSAGEQWVQLLATAGLDPCETDRGLCAQWNIDPVCGFIKRRSKLPEAIQSTYQPLIDALPLSTAEFTGIVRTFDVASHGLVTKNASVEIQAKQLQQLCYDISMEECGAFFNILTHLSQRFVFGNGELTDPDARPVLPVALAAPWKATADRLGTQPTLAYEAYILRNTIIHNNVDRTATQANLDDVTVEYTVSHTAVESGFARVHSLAELRGGCLPLLALLAPKWISETPDNGSKERILLAVLDFACERVCGVADAIRKMFVACSPASVYFHQVRPYMHGSAALPNGLIAEGLGETWTYSGGSGAQSPLVHLLDVLFADPNFPLPSHALDYLEKNRLMMSDAARNFLLIPDLKGLRAAVHALQSEKCTQKFNAILEHMATHRKSHANMVHLFVQKHLPEGERVVAAGVRSKVAAADILYSIRERTLQSGMTLNDEPKAYTVTPLVEINPKPTSTTKLLHASSKPVDLAKVIPAGIALALLLVVVHRYSTRTA